MNIKIERFEWRYDDTFNGKYYIFVDGKYLYRDGVLRRECTHGNINGYYDTSEEASDVLSKFLNNNKKVVEPKFNLDNLSLEELCVIKAALGTSLAGAVSDRLFERCNRLLKLDYSYTPIFSDFVMKWDYQGYRKLLQEVIEKAKSNF